MGFWAEGVTIVDCFDGLVYSDLFVGDAVSFCGVALKWCYGTRLVVEW